MTARQRILSLFLITTAALPTFAEDTDDSTLIVNWDGRYRYESQQGNTAGGTPIIMIHLLTVAKGETPCRLEINGYQTAENLLCAAETSGARIDINFVSHAGGSVKNSYGVAIYKPGETLFSLERSAQDGDLITHWGALTPDGVKSQSGAFFVKEAPGEPLSPPQQKRLDLSSPDKQKNESSE
ncbi:DUF5991 domain-containing protein [Hahella sp. HN01]|uniref:DUF5991 domain-containing protein n=1 Tax=Hahella sp. HN01 TaxID=2847262 RepID=UPI001C1EC4D1|nr:DUF5991 domain-containing protein [Hahella sp. HN01]MBU6951230.1 hypothetical protein [Hahella sp. HN01]